MTWYGWVGFVLVAAFFGFFFAFPVLGGIFLAVRDAGRDIRRAFKR